ncbi:right-handed parallel beta-helix repeat-containing protein [Mesorhizobium sp. Pch-S]|uniref:right-handed parallel beta-helix repeat-containing protein n=1 Tax=Mesorhizobium sp. Pch-S TaxID=2082387 RepID=UPI0010102A18|nr:right-handed parallel beta-helix repeat-containing protein [Mesorhizobium sp. Pch-S]QAZ45964.1 hypothetical protein C1M53_26640 [Mesorhizobium sp. Pch-S]
MSIDGIRAVDKEPLAAFDFLFGMSIANGQRVGPRPVGAQDVAVQIGSALPLGAVKAYPSVAAMNADTAPAAGTLAYAEGKTYRKTAASGSAGWEVFLDFIPGAQLISAPVTGGTSNAVLATSASPVSAVAYKQLILVGPFSAANPTAGMTVSINGEAPRALVTNTGDPIPPNYVRTKMSALVVLDADGKYRLFSYGDASAIQAAAEAAKLAAEAARDTTLAALSSVLAPRATRALAIADNPGASPDPEYYDVAYYDATYQPGSGARYRKRASTPGTPDAFRNRGGTGSWYSIDTAEKTPQMFGVCGVGGDDSAVFSALNTSGLTGTIYIPDGTYILENVTFRRSVCGAGPGRTILKHKANSTTVAFQIIGSSPTISNLTIDGDKANQPNRPTLMTANGGDFTFENVNFLNSVYTAIHLQNFVTAIFRGCIWRGMAYHGGTTGQQTMCALLEATDKALAIFDGCKFINVGSPSLSAPGGVLATHKSVSLIFRGNYFYRIGQGAASNFIGCIDAYQEGIDNVIVGNIFEEICYSAVKLSSSKQNLVADNIIDGFDSGGSTAIPAIVVAFRPTDQITQKVSVKGNVIGGTIGAGKSGIEVYGASGNSIQNVQIEGNIVTTPGTSILVQFANVVKILNNDVKSTTATNPIRMANLASASIDINGNTIRDSVGIPIDVTAADGCAGSIVSACGNTLIGGSLAVPIRMDGIARAKVNDNTMTGFGTASVRLYNIVGNGVVVGNMTDGAITLDTAGTTAGKIKDLGNTWNA